MLVVKEFCNKQRPLVKVDECTSYEAVTLCDSEIYGQQGLVNFTSILL